MQTPFPTRTSLLAACALMLAAATARASGPQAPVPLQQAAYVRWQAHLDAFAAADRQQPPLPGGVLFVGSSSIRLWDGLESQFGSSAGVVIKRGFGGSRMSDCASLVPRIVAPYSPRLVVVYAGDNDLAEGATPQAVAASVARFVSEVHAALPGTRVAFVSIKPSPARAHLLPQVQEANRLVAEHARATPNLVYIDVFTRMLAADGQPRAELFRSDMLHLNAAGYALWQEVIARHLGASDPLTAASLEAAALKATSMSTGATDAPGPPRASSDPMPR